MSCRVDASNGIIDRTDERRLFTARWRFVVALLCDTTCRHARACAKHVFLVEIGDESRPPRQGDLSPCSHELRGQRTAQEQDRTRRQSIAAYVRYGKQISALRP